jgi:hypothetical protein
VPSASPQLTRALALGTCAALLTGVASGCSTTQEKAERQQARAQHILDARAERQKHKHDKSKQDKDEKGSESQ